jgi:hypothetical protein
MVRIDLVDEQFGELLKSLRLPENWREVISVDRERTSTTRTGESMICDSP